MHAAWKETNWDEPQLLNKLDVDEVELILPMSSEKNAPVNAPIKLNNSILDYTIFSCDILFRILIAYISIKMSRYRHSSK